MSQTAFAQDLGVSYTTVNRWEMGKAKPTYKTMKLIDDYCKEKGIIRYSRILDPREMRFVL